MQLVGYDIEKPDIINHFSHLKLSAEEFYVSFPVIDVLRCRYCGSCVGFCPETALYFDRSIPRIGIIADRCKACGECIKGCHIHLIAGRERLSGYVLQGKVGDRFYTFGKNCNGHDYHLPLICRLNDMIRPEATAICDLPPGNSGFVKMALRDSGAAAVVVKPNRGWRRNAEVVTEMLTEMRIPFGIIINKIKNEESFVLEVREYCLNRHVELLGTIPYDSLIEQGKTSADADFSDDLKAIFAGIYKGIQKLAN